MLPGWRRKEIVSPVLFGLSLAMLAAATLYAARALLS